MARKNKKWDAEVASHLKNLIIERYGSIRAAARELGVDHANLSKVLNAKVAPSESLEEKLVKAGLFGVKNEEGIDSNLLKQNDQYQIEKKLLNFKDPSCAAFQWARKKVIEWYDQQCEHTQKIYAANFNCPILKGIIVTNSPCTPYDKFIFNVVLFLRLGGVITPTAVRGLLVELLDIPQIPKDELLKWIDHEIAPDPTARRLFFHAVGYTANPFYYIVEGGILQIDPAIRFADPESVIRIPSFMIEEVKKFVQENGGEV